MWRPQWLKLLRSWIATRLRNADETVLMSAPEPPALALSDRQRLLVEALGQINDQLVRIYRSSLVIASITEIPEYEVLAAHQARELMENLPLAVGCRWIDPKGKVEKLKSLMECYDEHAQSFNHLFIATVPTTVERPVLRYLAESDSTFRWYDKHVSTVRKNISVLVRHCHDTDTPSLRTVRTIGRQWMPLRQFFVDLCHHNVAVSNEELQERLDSLTELLLSLLRRPRPVADFNDIDTLISEGESNDH